MLEEESHGFSLDGTAQGLRYGRRGSLRHKGLPWFCRFHCEISILERVAKNPMKRGAQTRSNAWLKRRGTQVWKPAIRRWDAAVSAEELLRAFSA